MRRLLFTFLFICLYQPDYAQESFSPMIGVGFHAGYNYANMHFEPVINSSPVQVPNLGLIMNLEHDRHLGVQFELNYSQGGWKEGTDSTFTYSRVSDFLEFPILSNFTFTGKYISLGLNFGPYISFLRRWSDSFEIVDGYDTTAGSGSSPVFVSKPRYDIEFTHNTDFGLIFGLYAGYHSPIGDFLIRARVQQGVVNMFPRYPDGEFKFSQTRSMYLGMAYIYKFPYSRLKDKK